MCGEHFTEILAFYFHYEFIEHLNNVTQNIHTFLPPQHISYLFS